MTGMTAFIPVNSAILIRRISGEFTVDGQPKFAPGVKVGISVVRLVKSISPTSVRADKSGTKSYADEQLEKGRLLVHPRVEPREGDQVEFAGHTWSISSARPVYAMTGKVDHYEVDL